MTEETAIVNAGLYYDQPFSFYQGIDALNQSTAKILNSKSPGEAIYSLNNPEEKDAYTVGQAFHLLATEPGKFHSEFSIKPQGMKLNTKEGIAWKQAQGMKLILSRSDSDMVTGMVESVKRHHIARATLEKSEAFEVTAVATYRDIKLKGRFDAFAPALHTITDLKSTLHSVAPREFSKTIFNFGYAFQGAFYLLLAELLRINIKHFVIIAVSKQPPYPVAVYRLKNDAIAFGRKQLDEAITIYKQCLEANSFPFYPGITEVGLPAWATKEDE